MFDDPTCIYCNSVATRRAAQESAKADKQMLDMHQQAARAQRRTASAAKSEARRQERIEWSQLQKQKKQAQSAATKAARQAQGGGGLLPNEKLKIAAVLLLFWGHRHCGRIPGQELVRGDRLPRRRCGGGLLGVEACHQTEEAAGSRRLALGAEPLRFDRVFGTLLKDRGNRFLRVSVPNNPTRPAPPGAARTSVSCTPPILLPYIDDPELIRLVEADGLLSPSEPRKGVLQSVGKVLYVQARGLIVVPIGVKSSKMILCMVLRGNESTQEGPIVTIGWDQLSYAPELGVRLPDDPPSLDADKGGSVGDDDSESAVDDEESTDIGSDLTVGEPREKLLFVPPPG